MIFFKFKVFLRSDKSKFPMYSSVKTEFEQMEPESLEITSNDDLAGNEPYLNELDFFDARSEMDFVFPHEENFSSERQTVINQGNSLPKWENVFLTSMTIMNQNNQENVKRSKSLKVECQLWTRGFDRSFKVIFCLSIELDILGC